MNINGYIEAAKLNSGVKSNRKLSDMLGLSCVVVSQWVTGKSYPSDEIMEKLAIMAGVDPTEALIDLNIWRTTGRAQLTYQKIRSAIMAGATACYAIMIYFLPVPAYAGQVSTFSGDKCILRKKKYFSSHSKN